jgi:hypothetical protein
MHGLKGFFFGSNNQQFRFVPRPFLLMHGLKGLEQIRNLRVIVSGEKKKYITIIGKPEMI